MNRRVLVTGSRHWVDRATIEKALRLDIGLGDCLVTGACPTGADAIAEDIWLRWGLGTIDRHPADWARHGKAAGPIRNQQMVDLGAAVCLAFPLPDSRGTRHCMAAAERAGIPIVVYEPGAANLVAARVSVPGPAV